MLAVWDRDLPHPEKSILTVMAYFADDAGGSVRCSMATTARRAGYSIRQAHAIVDRLRKRLILVSQGRYSVKGQRGYVPVYRIDLSHVPIIPDESARTSQTLDEESLQTSQTNDSESLRFPRESVRFEGGKSAVATADEQLNSNTEQKKTLPPKNTAADPRHVTLKDFILDEHAAVNGMDRECVPWNGREGAALNKWLAENPRVSVEDSQRCIRNYYHSDCVNIAQRPAKLIPQILEFWAGELDQYKKPRHFDKAKEARHSEATVGMHTEAI
jgi:hypothetical protein